MTWLRAAAREILGLFIDDGRLAVLIVLWVALAGVVLGHLLPAPWGSLVFAAGLGAVLAESVLRRARGR